MKYDATIKNNNIEITVKVTNKQLSGKYTLPEFLKTVRNLHGHTLKTVHLLTDFIEENCRKMEDGEIPISKRYLQWFTSVYKLPRKIIRLGERIDPDKELHRFPERLYELRLNADFTQQYVADYIGVARTTYAGYESGKNEPDISTLLEIAKMYKVSLDYLIGRYN